MIIKAEKGNVLVEPATDVLDRLEDMYEVRLFNDDHNACEYVVMNLMQIFGHTLELAARIMLEAHNRGMAIAEVEGESEARLHRDQLVSAGLSAEICKI